MSKHKKDFRAKDLTARYMMGDVDEDRDEPQQRGALDHAPRLYKRESIRKLLGGDADVKDALEAAALFERCDVGPS